MASIRTAGLAKNFGDLRAVNEIDLDLPEGGVAGFVGPNGAGKSTTIRMLLGLITPTGGEGEVFGHPIGRPAAYLHRFNRPTTPTLSEICNCGKFSRERLGSLQVAPAPRETVQNGRGVGATL
jgi:ABC-type Mn2+/Zn2+ transport system ATPase subunit